MGHTDGRWTQGTTNPDLNIFIGADNLVDFAAVATLPAAPSAGLLFKTVGNNAAAKFFASIPLFLRAGIPATPAYSQEQFGTAAAQPGPSLVAGTSGPLALPGPFPPILGASMATVAGPTSGLGKKGIQINSIDVIYQVLGLAATVATVGVTTTTFGNLVAPVVANLLTLAANGLPTAIGAQVQRTNVALTTPAMIIPTLPTEVIVNLNLTGGATGTVNVYGINLQCSYNLN